MDRSGGRFLGSLTESEFREGLRGGAGSSPARSDVVRRLASPLAAAIIGRRCGLDLTTYDIRPHRFIQALTRVHIRPLPSRRENSELYSIAAQILLETGPPADHPSDPYNSTHGIYDP